MYNSPEKQNRYHRRLYRAKRRRGECGRCKHQAEAGKTRCAVHAVRNTGRNLVAETKYRGSQKAKANRRAYRYKRRGITPEDFEKKIVKQKGMCPIGPHPFGPKGSGKNAPCLDHNHETDENRGVLCRLHNQALGVFHDSIVELEMAIEYLKEWEK